jgi:hypothetical protein
MRGYAVPLALAVIASGFLAFGSSSAFACSCVSAEDQRRSAGTIFAGRVDEIRQVGNYEQLVKFRAEQAWKGVSEQEVTVTNYLSPFGTCGSRHFTVGERYLVYAYGKPEDLEVGGCSLVIGMENAQADLDILGLGYVPAGTRSDLVITESGVGPLPVIFGTGAAVAAVVVFVTLRRKS